MRKQPQPSRYSVRMNSGIVRETTDPTIRRYPSGEPIPVNLPESYYLAEPSAERKCGNCRYDLRGFCMLYNAYIRADYTCMRWEAI